MHVLKSSALGLLVAAGMAATGQQATAAPITTSTTYVIDGRFKDDTLLTGSFDYDGSNFSNVNIHTQNGIIPAAEYDEIEEWDSDYLWLDFLSDGNGLSDANELFIRLDSWMSGSTISITGEEVFYGSTVTTRYFNSGTITPASTTVTPLPAALPLAASALAGLGGMGWLKRRRTGALVNDAI